ncbi:MAG: divalent metal cation transporter [Bacteroidetes bacterium]|nr:MAG: divalent metal cation transporter [Bacteroidota bacterium]
MRKVFGPGLLFAATAIGVSHLVQSARAGAEYGWSFAIIILFANIIKFPFFEFGTRYAEGTGESLISGYTKMGKWVTWIYAFSTLASMFTVTGAVSIVTAGLTSHLLGLNVSIEVITTSVFVLCFLWLAFGKFAFLDISIKIITSILAISTLVAFVIACSDHGGGGDFVLPDFTQGETLVFTIALIGWMPTAVDLSVWNSIWTVEKNGAGGDAKRLKSVLLDFHIGYWLSAISALLFLGLGVMLMYGNAVEFPSGAVGFTGALIDIYTDTLGSGFKMVIVTAATAAMFSTTLSVFDGYGRTTLELSRSLLNTKGLGYWGAVLVVAVGGWTLVSLFADRMTDLIEIAMITSFLTSPIVAYFNYKLVNSENFPLTHRPGPFMLKWAQFGLVAIVLLTAVFLVMS